MTQDQTTAATRLETELFVSKMDCPSEENLIRMALGKVDDVDHIAFDLNTRTVTVLHHGNADAIVEALQSLRLGVELRGSRPAKPASQRTISTLGIPKMDCPSEENMIRMALADVDGIQSLNFDLPQRQLHVSHTADVNPILAKLAPLNFGTHLIGSRPDLSQAAPDSDKAGDASEAKTLRLLLAINAVMFVVELVWGLIAQSAGLVADSLDMFADAAVYGLALYAVGRAAALKTRAAHVAGWLQLVLALGALSEVVRRAFFGSEPESALMMGVGAVALVANVACLVLIAKKRDRGAHMKASYIFSANDVIANLGVIAAGALVIWTGSPYPDLIVGTVIAVIVLTGARRILKLK
ncbi:MAG: cation transporter [Janthinobacterium lividum]|uniref:Heavy-metal-associated domain-containing protein n=1 Tax=Massilia yuzhufengensis TaxID=1164594 RepID=A0A1I1VT62_9BURK|nr:cation transporter [Massilia yuzhufengensis]SFD86226.1 Heavy-metal-associated domain-containing protein [Massilia yuzhufengensis]